MRYFLLFILLFSGADILGQSTGTSPGMIIGNIIDANNSKAISGSSVELINIADTVKKTITPTQKNGAFSFDHLPYGYYRLKITNIGYRGYIIDSINIRAERFDFDLNDIKLDKSTTLLNEVIIYAEKPLIESKDGKIIFNSGESALSSGSTTTELLKQTPLVNIDNDGKVLLRGKEVKILIDDKPVELNGKQLQDFLESIICFIPL